MRMKMPAIILISCGMVCMCAGAYAKPKIPQENIEYEIPVVSEVKWKVEGLYSNDPLERAAAVDALGDMGDKAANAIPFLIGMLDDIEPCPEEGVRYISKPLVRDRVIKALVKIGPRAIQPLIDALRQEKKGEVRAPIIYVLGSIRNDRVVPQLLDSLDDTELLVRGEVLKALGKIGGSRALRSLLDSLKDKNEYMRSCAAEALGNLEDPFAVDYLIGVLDDGSSVVRAAALKALYQITEARVPSHDPAVWKDWWGKHKVGFKKNGP